MFENISIIGDGAMGTVLAVLLCEKQDSSAAPQNDMGKGRITSVRMWGYDAEQLKQIEKARENKKFLPGYKLPASLVFEPDDERIMTGADLVVSAVPCQCLGSQGH
jgi:glycerol-3-phosphate dehydrogenase (NAD(P)+)